MVERFQSLEGFFTVGLGVERVVGKMGEIGLHC